MDIFNIWNMRKQMPKGEKKANLDLCGAFWFYKFNSSTKIGLLFSLHLPFFHFEIAWLWESCVQNKHLYSKNDFIDPTRSYWTRERSVFCGDDKAKGKTVQVGEQEIVKFGMQFGTTCHQGDGHFELLLGHSLEPTHMGLSEPDLIAWTQVFPFWSVASPGYSPVPLRTRRGLVVGSLLRVLRLWHPGWAPVQPARLPSGRPLGWRVKSSEAYTWPLRSLSSPGPDHVVTWCCPVPLRRVPRGPRQLKNGIHPPGRVQPTLEEIPF